jgi:hypothetical protein
MFPTHPYRKQTPPTTRMDTRMAGYGLDVALASCPGLRRNPSLVLPYEFNPA